MAFYWTVCTREEVKNFTDADMPVILSHHMTDFTDADYAGNFITSYD